MEKTWNSMEETGAFVATPWWQVCLPILVWTVGLYCPYGTCFPLDVVWGGSSTSQFAAAIAWDGIEDDNQPFGSGRPFLGCSHLNKAIFAILFTDQPRFKLTHVKLSVP